MAIGESNNPEETASAAESNEDQTTDDFAEAEDIASSDTSDSDDISENLGNIASDTTFDFAIPIETSQNEINLTTKLHLDLTFALPDQTATTAQLEEIEQRYNDHIHNGVAGWFRETNYFITGRRQEKRQEREAIAAEFERLDTLAQSNQLQMQDLSNIHNLTQSHILEGQAAQTSAIATTASISLGIGVGLVSAGIGGAVSGTVTRMVFGNVTRSIGAQAFNMTTASVMNGAASSLLTWGGENILNHALFDGEQILATDWRSSFIDGLVAIPTGKFAATAGNIFSQPLNGFSKQLIGKSTELFFDTWISGTTEIGKSLTFAPVSNEELLSGIITGAVVNAAAGGIFDIAMRPRGGQIELAYPLPKEWRDEVKETLKGYNNSSNLSESLFEVYFHDICDRFVSYLNDLNAFKREILPEIKAIVDDSELQDNLAIIDASSPAYYYAQFSDLIFRIEWLNINDDLTKRINAVQQEYIKIQNRHDFNRADLAILIDKYETETGLKYNFETTDIIEFYFTLYKEGLDFEGIKRAALNTIDEDQIELADYFLYRFLPTTKNINSEADFSAIALQLAAMWDNIAVNTKPGTPHTRDLEFGGGRWRNHGTGELEFKIFKGDDGETHTSSRGGNVDFHPFHTHPLRLHRQIGGSSSADNVMAMPRDEALDNDPLSSSEHYVAINSRTGVELPDGTNIPRDMMMYGYNPEYDVEGVFVGRTAVLTREFLSGTPEEVAERLAELFPTRLADLPEGWTRPDTVKIDRDIYGETPGRYTWTAPDGSYEVIYVVTKPKSIFFDYYFYQDGHDVTKYDRRNGKEL